MGRVLLRVTRAEKEWFLEWSSVTDAPATYGMSEDELREYWKDEYGRRGMFDLDNRIARARVTGTDSRFRESADRLIHRNRAGRHESELTMEQIIDTCCVECVDPGERPLGIFRDEYDRPLTPSEYQQWCAQQGYATPDFGDLAPGTPKTT